MNYGFLTHKAFAERLDELRNIGGVSIPLLKKKYAKDFDAYEGTRVNKVRSLNPNSFKDEKRHEELIEQAMDVVRGNKMTFKEG